MRIAIIQFPGSNCERETMAAVQRAGMEAVEYLWNEPTAILADCDGFVVVGGFSYGDRSRAGIIAALDPIIAVLRTQSRLGKPILGICNGAQILVETGLVPGLEKNQIGAALTTNKRVKDGAVVGTGFYNAWVQLRLSDNFQYNAFTRHLTPKDILTIPVAHAEGRFLLPPVLLQEVQQQGLNIFQYCTEQGVIAPDYPCNPNGSMDNIAALSNKAGNVLAMMPHPERTNAGNAIFASMRDYIKAGHFNPVHNLSYQPRQLQPIAFQPKPQSFELIVELIIADNEAMTVQQALLHHQLPIHVKRYQHWELICASAAVFEQIIASGVLFNERKEKVVTLPAKSSAHAKRYLTRAKDDIQGLQKQQLLTKQFAVAGIDAVHYGVLWDLESQTDARLAEHVLQTHILFNPYATDCYEY